MSTPNMDGNSTEVDAANVDHIADPGMVGILDSTSDKGKAASGESDWINTASFIFGGIVAVGFLLVVFGEYLVSSSAVVLAGTAVISLGGIAWGLAALVLVSRMIKRWFTSDSIVHK